MPGELDAQVCDGMDFIAIGWPFVFRASGGEFQGPFYDFTALYIDIAACAGIAMLTGLALKDGGRRVSTTMARFLRGRSLIPHPRFDWEK